MSSCRSRARRPFLARGWWRRWRRARSCTGTTTAQRRASFATELDRPVARFTLGGWLAVASAATCQVYRTEGHRIRLEAECPGGKVEPLAVLDTADPNQFALFGTDGVVRLYEMPHR